MPSSARANQSPDRVRQYRTLSFSSTPMYRCTWLERRTLTKSLSNGGLVDASLGGCVYRQRIPLHGRGKSGVLRTLIAFRGFDKAFFIYGFAKNKQANVADDELKILRILAVKLLEYKADGLQRMVAAGELVEVVIHE